MKDKKMIMENIGVHLLKIGELYRKITASFPAGNESLLKHLAASSIHLTLFSRDLAEILIGHKFPKEEETEKEFLQECGCDFNKKINKE